MDQEIGDNQVELIQAAYDPQRFQALGHLLIDALAAHFRQLQTSDRSGLATTQRSGELPVLNWAPPRENVALAESQLRAGDESRGELGRDAAMGAWLDRCAELIRTALHRGQNLHHPRYVGHQVPASIPLAALFDALGAATNQVMAIYEMGPWSTGVERALIDRLAARIGFAPDSACGLCTHGGSLANLTALLTARNASLGASWQDGLSQAAPAPVLLVQSDIHYSVLRAAGILGLGTNHVLRIPLDDRRRLDPRQLDGQLRTLAAAGTPVVAVCAAACATPIGAFDPLPAVTEVCRHHGVWLHVDAAHGGALLFSRRHRHRVEGLVGADSVVLDAHKMLFMPALCAFVFYRDSAHRFTAFQQNAPYLFDPAAPGMAEFDNGTQTLECTKRAAAFGLWGLWSMFGDGLFEQLVDRVLEVAAIWAGLLREADDFELLHEPEGNIVVFRHVPVEVRSWSDDRLGNWQLMLRRRVVESGEAYLVPIQLDGVGALRTTIMNPLTQREDLQQIMTSIRSAGRQLLGEMEHRGPDPVTGLST